MATPAAAPALTLLLPERRRYAGQPLSPAVARALARADVLPAGEAGERAQLLRHFDLLPRGWPMAAITRSLDADDAHLHTWLRADPAHVRPDMTGARVLAIGELGLSAEEANALVAPLRSLFGDAGFPISAPQPSRWYLALPREAKLPEFSPPEAVLGDDLFSHLPDGPEGRRWRALLNEAQILLHNHPVNAARAAAGRITANSLCFWGAGRLPDRVLCAVPQVVSADPGVMALARLAGANPDSSRHELLLDLRSERDWNVVEKALLETLAGTLGGVQLDFADGTRLALESRQRFRFWRRPLAKLA
jgi:hypothetical protein